MKIISFLENLDKRWIYILIALAVIIPFIFPIGCPMKTTPPVESMFSYIEDSIPDGGTLLIGVDYDPSTMAELQPMLKAIVEHAFSNNIRVMMVTLYPQGTGLALDAINTSVASWNEHYPESPKAIGTDITLFPYVPGVSAVVLKMGESIIETFNADAYGNPLSDLPIMKGVRNYEDIDYFIDLAGSSVVVTWLTYANGRYGQKMGIGTTAVSTAEYYTYLQSGQATGLLGGLRGAAEYEKLLEAKGYMKGRKDATVGMDAQSSAHVVFLLLVILGNTVYFIKRKKERE